MPATTRLLMWRRAGYVRLVVARVKYKVGDGDAATFATTELPRELITRSLAAPSQLAHIERTLDVTLRR